MLTLNQTKPVLRSVVVDEKVASKGVQASDACAICRAGCSLLSGWKKKLCNLGCDATVC